MVSFFFALFPFNLGCSMIIVDIEIDPEVDFDSRRAVYFRQMRYGLFVSGCHTLVSFFIQTSSKGSHGSPH